MIQRRTFVAGIAAVMAAPLAAEAQPAGKTHRIGFLANSPRPPEAGAWDSLVAGLRDLGYVEGRNLEIERQFIDGKPQRWSELARELVARRVEVIVVATTPAALAAQQASRTIPIVHAVANDPVTAGLAASLARPGGNVTGIAVLSPEVTSKGLTLLKEAHPRLSRIAVIWNAANPANASVWTETQAVSRALGMTVHSQQIRQPPDLEEAFQSLAGERLDGMVVANDDLIFQHREQIVRFALQNRLALAAPLRAYTELGGLLSYGPVVYDAFRRAASHVHKLLNGVNPADLPFEQPTKFALVINARTARSLGITIPPSLLLRTDHVIE